MLMSDREDKDKSMRGAGAHDSKFLSYFDNLFEVNKYSGWVLKNIYQNKRIDIKYFTG